MFLEYSMKSTVIPITFKPVYKRNSKLRILFSTAKMPSFVLLVSFAISANVVLCILPSAVPVKDCYVKDKTKFHGCFIEFIKAEFPKAVKNGILQYKVPSMDPLHLSFIEYTDQGDALQATAKFMNSTVHGGSTVTIDKINPPDTKARTLTASGSLQYLNASGQYTMKGHILVMPVDSKGPYTLEMIHPNLTVTFHLGLVGSDVKVNKVDVAFDVKDAILKFGGFMDGDTIGSAISNLIAKNSKQIFEDLKPLISRELEKALLIVAKDFLTGLPPELFIA
ncbi:hypothetical protein CHUAL_009845 [Chamberlinius hualienensis]